MRLDTIGIVGAGMMGSGIAQACATAGLDVILTDVNDAIAKKGVTTIANDLDRRVAKGKFSAADKEKALARIKCLKSYSALAPADIVIEAATESSR